MISLIVCYINFGAFCTFWFFNIAQFHSLAHCWSNGHFCTSLCYI